MIWAASTMYFPMVDCFRTQGVNSLGSPDYMGRNIKKERSEEHKQKWHQQTLKYYQHINLGLSVRASLKSGPGERLWKKSPMKKTEKQPRQNLTLTEPYSYYLSGAFFQTAFFGTLSPIQCETTPTPSHPTPQLGKLTQHDRSRVGPPPPPQLVTQQRAIR